MTPPRAALPRIRPGAGHSRRERSVGERPRLEPWWLWWGGATLAWTINGLVAAAQIQSMRAASGAPVPWSAALRASLTSAWLWVPLTIFAFWSAARVPIERGNIIRPVLVHVAASVGAAVVRMLAVIVLNPWIGWYSTALPPLSQLFVTSLNNNLLIYWLLAGVGHAVHYARTARLHQELLADAQLLVLKSQLQPHFLFNALNTISAFVRSDPGTAERMIDRLARLLRHALDAATVREVSLREELAALEPYIDIEQTRFADRLRVERCIEPDVLDCAVPHFLLQPLVENAVRHGVGPRSSGGTVRIAAHREQDDVVIEVRDDGVGLRAGFAEHDWGVGLRNTRDRLAHLYGGADRLQLVAAGDGGVRSVVRVPRRSARGES